MFESLACVSSKLLKVTDADARSQQLLHLMVSFDDAVSDHDVDQGQDHADGQGYDQDHGEPLFTRCTHRAR